MKSTRSTLLEFDLQYLNGKYPGVSRGRVASGLRSALRSPRSRLLHRLVARDRRQAMRRIESTPALDALYRSYVAKTQSTGVEPGDYWRLFDAVRRLKPRAVLECGTGLSTTALGAACLLNVQEGFPGRVVSMEESPTWYDHARRLLPEPLVSVVEIRHSPRVTRSWEGREGACYEDIPDHPYDFAFIDGPSQERPDGPRLFDLDLAFVARRNPNIVAFIDHRLNTVHALRELLQGTHRVTYSPVTKLGYATPRRNGGS